jgi:hypothetical protein
MGKGEEVKAAVDVLDYRVPHGVEEGGEEDEEKGVGGH